MLHIAQHIFIHANYHHSILASSYSGVLMQTLCAENKYYPHITIFQHRNQSSSFHFHFLQEFQMLQLCLSSSYLQTNHTDLPVHIAYTHYLIIYNPVQVIPELFPFFNILFSRAIHYSHIYLNPSKLELTPAHRVLELTNAITALYYTLLLKAAISSLAISIS